MIRQQVDRYAVVGHHDSASIGFILQAP